MRNYEKFFTPPDIALFMAQLLAPEKNDVILEPSAGNGSLVKAVKEVCPDTVIFAFEADKKYEKELRGRAHVVVIKDFLKTIVYAKCSKCIANPPFGNDTDFQAHFDHIRAHVKKGGMIVMITPKEFDPQIEHVIYFLDNWSENSDGTKTEIKIIAFNN